MRLVFAGTPEFAAVALRALIAAGHDIPLVLTQPDRPAGRGMKLKASPVKELALARGIPVHQPERLRTAESQVPIRAARADAMVVAAYGLILPRAVLDIPRLGCVNIHASLLPRWRGAAPIQRAILAGDRVTGITLMQMNAGLDTGAMLSRAELAIDPQDTAASLHDRLAELGGREIVALLPRLEAAQQAAMAQDEGLATYAAKIAKEEATLDWSLAAEVLHRQVRAFNPFPGAATRFQGEPLKVWRAELASGSSAPGELLAVTPEGIVVACGKGALRLTELQKAGGKRLDAGAFLAGHLLQAGMRLCGD